jgi:hypothetical protein
VGSFSSLDLRAGGFLVFLLKMASAVFEEDICMGDCGLVVEEGGGGSVLGAVTVDKLEEEMAGAVVIDVLAAEAAGGGLVLLARGLIVTSVEAGGLGL